MLIYSDNKSCITRFIDKNLFVKRYLSQNNNLDFLLKSFLNKKSIFYNAEHLCKWDLLLIAKNSSGSQFDILNNLISDNYEVPNKIALLAEEGSGFHGFRNRKWNVKRGNIHLTIFFKPKNNVENFHVGLLIVAAVSVLQTIDLIPDLKGKALTKWVNDIVINNAKVCGIITKSFSSGNMINGALIGLGLNVLSKPNFEKDLFTNSANSLLEISNSDNCNLQFILTNLLERLNLNIGLLLNNKFNSLFHEYCNRSAVIGKEVAIYSDPIDSDPKQLTSGKVTSINEDLNLFLDNSNTPISSGRLAIID